MQQGEWYLTPGLLSHYLQLKPDVHIHCAVLLAQQVTTRGERIYRIVLCLKQQNVFLNNNCVQTLEEVLIKSLNFSLSFSLNVAFSQIETI